MPRNKQIDAYIASAPDWAQPILTSLRDTVHAACPEAEEAVKWSRPAFMYHGKILAGMVAFKQHAALYFWNGSQIVPDRPTTGDGAASQFGRLTSLEDLPPKKTITAHVKKAMELIDAGVKPARAPAKKRPALATPDYFMAALKKNRKALAAFEMFSPSHRREYIEWITDAKTDATRDKRVAQAVEWMSEGKPRNWKYMRVKS